MSQMPNFVPQPAAPQWGGPPYQQTPQYPGPYQQAPQYPGQYPQPPQYPGQWPPALPPKPPRRNTGLLIGLLVLVAVLVLALVAWLVFRPSNSPTGTASSSETVSPAPPPPLPPSFDKMAWSTPAALGTTATITALNVNDSGADGIVIVSWNDSDWNWTAAAVETKTMKVLWTKPDMFYWDSDASGVLLSAGYGASDSVSLVDPRTGTVKWEASGVMTSGHGFIVTLDGPANNPDTICARKTASPDACFWTSPRNINEESTDLSYHIIGGGAWLETRSGVLNMATGRPAPFGSDVNIGLDGGMFVQYMGPSKDRILRAAADLQADSPIWRIQRWDVASNKGIGPTYTAPDGESLGWTFDTESPSYLLSDNTGVTAFSWQTGQQQWQAEVPNGAGCAGIHGNVIVVGPYCGTNGETGSIMPGVTALDLATGQKIWSDPSLAQLINNGAGNIGQVLFLMDAQTLYAYDNGSFTKLGSVALPTNTNFVDVAAGTVFASSGNQLYMLQT